MYHHVALGQVLEAFVVEPEAVGGHVAGHGGDTGGHLGVEPFTELLTEQVETVVLQNLAGGPLQGRRPSSRSDEEDHPAVRDAAQYALDQGGSQKSGGPGDEELFAGEGIADTGHEICLPYGK